MKYLILSLVILMGCTTKEQRRECVKTCADANHKYEDVEEIGCGCKIKVDPSELGSRQPEE